MRSRLRWEAGLEGVAGSYTCRDKAAASAHARWLCVGDLVVEPELHVVLLQLRRGALVTVQQQGLRSFTIMEKVESGYYRQGDYDGSGQQSCKCTYVDFSK